MIGFKQFLLELEHLHDTRTKKGDEFLDHLLNDKVTINIKIDQAAFVIRKKDGQVTYHGREGRGDITKVKRASMDTYEEGIQHIESRPLNKLPDNIEVFLELFSDKWQTAVQYKTKPKGNLMISYIKRDGKMVLPGDELNQTVANILDVDPPPVLFEGRLTNKQKAAIKSFIVMDVEERKQKYGQTKFLNFIMSIFVTPEKLKWLHEGGYEGIVFYFGEGEAHYTAKMVDPMFTAEKQEEKKEDVSEFHKNLHEVIHKYIKQDVVDAANAFKKSSNIATAEDAYIEFISFLTKYIVNQHKKELSQLDKYEHEQKSRRFSNLTYSMLPSYMKQLSKEHWWVEELYSTLSNMLSKEARRIDLKKGLTQERKEAVNQIVKELRNKGLGV